jgi:hypothetical protein
VIFVPSLSRSRAGEGGGWGGVSCVSETVLVGLTLERRPETWAPEAHELLFLGVLGADMMSRVMNFHWWRGL